MVPLTRKDSQVFGKVRRGQPRNVGLQKPTPPGGRGGPATSITCAQADKAFLPEMQPSGDAQIVYAVRARRIAKYARPMVRILPKM